MLHQLHQCLMYPLHFYTFSIQNPSKTGDKVTVKHHPHYYELLEETLLCL